MVRNKEWVPFGEERGGGREGRGERKIFQGITYQCFKGFGIDYTLREADVFECVIELSEDMSTVQHALIRELIRHTTQTKAIEIIMIVCVPCRILRPRPVPFYRDRDV